MPVIAVGAAIAADVIAGAAVAGTVGGITAITAATALSVVAAVGATVAAIGVVTRDKTLTMVGGAIGLVGAVGGLASAAGVFGAADAPLFGAAPAASTADAAGAAGGGFAEGLTPATAGTAGGAIDTTSTFGGEAAGITAADAASANTIPFVADGLPEGQSDIATFSSISDKAADPATTLASNVNPADGLTGAAATSPIDPATGLQATDTSTNTTANGLINGQSGTGGDAFGSPNTNPDFLAGKAQGTTAEFNPTQYSGASNSAFGSVMKFVNDNKTLAGGVMTVGGKLLEGTFSTLDPAKVEALQAQAAANTAAAALANQQRANLAMPKAVANSTPVTGTPGPIIPPRAGTGLINQSLAPVTGAPT